MKSTAVLTCHDIEQFVYDYVEEELSPELCEELHRHLRQCADCARFMETYCQIARPREILREVVFDPQLESRMIQHLKNTP